MKLKKDSTEQKLRGAYYTPLQLANAMVSLFARERIGTVLEPSCGDGVFLDSLVQLDMLARVDALRQKRLGHRIEVKTTSKSIPRTSLSIMDECLEKSSMI